MDVGSPQGRPTSLRIITVADTICAIDVGTTKVCALIAEVINESTIEIVGWAERHRMA